MYEELSQICEDMTPDELSFNIAFIRIAYYSKKLSSPKEDCLSILEKVFELYESLDAEELQSLITHMERICEEKSDH